MHRSTNSIGFWQAITYLVFEVFMGAGLLYSLLFNGWAAHVAAVVFALILALGFIFGVPIVRATPEEDHHHIEEICYL